jgi:hypothetical protein
MTGPSLYPPTSPVGYRRLLHAIHSSPLDRLKKDCFYYYLLKTDGGEEAGDIGENVQERGLRFAESRCLSKTWRVFMDGYWNLDHGRWEVSPSSLILIISMSASSSPIFPLHAFSTRKRPDHLFAKSKR